MVGGTPSHNITPCATGNGGCGFGGGGLGGSTITFAFRSGENRFFSATSAKSITLIGPTFSSGASPGTFVAGRPFFSSAKSRARDWVHSARRRQKSSPATTSNTKSNSRSFRFISSKLRQSSALRNQAPRHQSGNRQPHRHNFLLRMRRPEANLLRRNKLLLRA